MKGIVFKELIEMVENKFGEDMVETIISRSKLSSEGAYTSVGTYDYKEILELVSNLSKETSMPVSALVKTFGKHLAVIFSKSHPDFFKVPDALSFLKTVDQIIHVEVKKLYPEAELPQFSYEEPEKNKLVMNYNSSRPFADLAEGLIEGVISHFNESITVTTLETSNEKNTTRTFLLQKV